MLSAATPVAKLMSVGVMGVPASAPIRPLKAVCRAEPRPASTGSSTSASRTAVLRAGPSSSMPKCGSCAISTETTMIAVPRIRQPVSGLVPPGPTPRRSTPRPPTDCPTTMPRMNTETPTIGVVTVCTTTRNAPKIPESRKNQGRRRTRKARTAVTRPRRPAGMIRVPSSTSTKPTEKPVSPEATESPVREPSSPFTRDCTAMAPPARTAAIWAISTTAGLCVSCGATTEGSVRSGALRGLCGGFVEITEPG